MGLSSRNRRDSRAREGWYFQASTWVPLALAVQENLVTHGQAPNGQPVAHMNRDNLNIGDNQRHLYLGHQQ